jgi:hypothetical protein
MAEYADLEIRILEKQKEGYPVEMTLNSEQQFPRGYIDSEFSWVPTGTAAEDGTKLFEALLADEALKMAWAEVRGQQPRRRIRLRIDASAPELHAIPWELLRDPGDGAPQDLAAMAATPFSRYMAGRQQPGSPVLKRPVRVLVAIAAPDNLGKFQLEPIDPDVEWALLQGAAAEQADIELTRLEQPCTLSALEEALKKGYHVLHFVGHGAFVNDQATLFMADKENQVVRESGEKVAGMLTRQMSDADLSNDERLRLVFLSSCQTATRSPADAFRGLAPQLVEAGVPAVVAMQDLVPIDTARQFSATFYKELMGHGMVDLASNEARSAVLTAGLPGAAIPVLFSRLRSSQLLGKRGRITSAMKGQFWPFLMGNIKAERVTAFLGPRINEGLLMPNGTAAENLAKKYNYPLPDRGNLAHVAQYIQLTDPDLLRDDYVRLLQVSLFRYLDITPTPEQKKQFGSAGLTETVEGLDWAERVLAIDESAMHHQLADLGLSLYVTTNIDNFMVEALKHKGRAPQRVGPRWEKTEAGQDEWLLKPKPSREEPVVFHLNGYDADPEQLRHLVLSEDDFLEHLVRLSRDRESILPMNMASMLSQHSFLFLGYHLDDWEFRVILQGLVKSIAGTTEAKKLHVGVQLEVEEQYNTEQAMDYLGRYLGEFRIDIYWGTTHQFVNELHSGWLDYQKQDQKEDDPFGL